MCISPPLSSPLAHPGTALQRRATPYRPGRHHTCDSSDLACDLKGSPPADLKRVLAPTSGPREAPERPGKIGKIRKIGKPFKQNKNKLKIKIKMQIKIKIKKNNKHIN